ncbi:MAG: hypothetical protein M1549_02530 [Candidatus Dependentiae bacterium]|nr:hypothetical protein [Candidatus Dependentiae bacterium]
MIKRFLCVGLLLSSVLMQATKDGDENGPVTPKKQTGNMNEVVNADENNHAATVVKALFSLSPHKNDRVSDKLKTATVCALLWNAQNREATQAGSDS